MMKLVAAAAILEVLVVEAEVAGTIDLKQCSVTVVYLYLRPREV